jgi:aspartyl-tRNA(Asn)/glutamyl-tRNA(Gln) amidotransferase subunit B
MPGVLPVMNKRAFELSVQAALALNCKINQRTFFDRKNYYYPDLPKNYQISQNYCNLGMNGYLEIPVDGTSRKIGIHNVHLEEDAGKNIHGESTAAGYSLVDLNRAGTPLLEIVSAPDMRSVEEARAFMETLRQILLYSGISDCKMQEGSLRFEASVSLRPAGQKELGARVEIKNLNSMKAVSACLDYEIRRQTDVLRSGGTVARETRLWDAERGRSARMRSKEEAHDYRYFPDPDLPEFTISDERLSELQASLPELPASRKRRFIEGYNLSEYDAGVLTGSRELADYFEEAVRSYDNPKSIANWIMNNILAVLNERSISISEFEVTPANLGELVGMIDDGKVTAQAARDVLEEMIETGKDAGTLVKEMGAEAISASDELEPIIEEAMKEAADAVQDYLGGRKKAIGAIVGQVMRLTKGQADPKKARELLEEKLEEME